MKSSKIITTIIVLLILVGLGLVFKNNTAEAPQTQDEVVDELIETAEVTPSPTDGQSLRDLLALTGSNVCTISQETDVETMTGTVSIKDGKLHGNYKTSIATIEQAIESNFVIEESTLFTWNSLTENGFTINVPAEPVTDPQDPAFGFDIPLNYVCENGEISDDIFALPELEFLTLEELEAAAAAEAESTPQL